MICLLRVVYRALLVRFPLSSIFYVRISRKVFCILSVICNFFFFCELFVTQSFSRSDIFGLHLLRWYRTRCLLCLLLVSSSSSRAVCFVSYLLCVSHALSGSVNRCRTFGQLLMYNYSRSMAQKYLHQKSNIQSHSSRCHFYNTDCEARRKFELNCK